MAGSLFLPKRWLNNFNPFFATDQSTVEFKSAFSARFFSYLPILRMTADSLEIRGCIARGVRYIEALITRAKERDSGGLLAFEFLKPFVGGLPGEANDYIQIPR